jgi:large subunit ribosomal protein L35
MPKQKTHSGTKKRIKVTGSGKLMHERTHKRHLLEHKPSRRTRRLTGTVQLAPSERKRVRRLLAR